MADVPDNLLYTKTHQWFDPENNRVGLTAFAAEQLGEISFVDVETLDGAELEQVQMDGEEPSSDPIDATVESSKAVGDVYSPVSGAVTEVNGDLFDMPEAINEDPYGKGWLFAVDPSNLDGEKGNLLTAAQYKEFIAGLE